MVSLIKRAAKKLRKIRKNFRFHIPSNTHTQLSPTTSFSFLPCILYLYTQLSYLPLFFSSRRQTNERTNERKKKAKNFHEEMLQRIKCRPTENKFFFRTIPTSPQPLIDFRFSFFFPYNIIYFTNFSKSIISRSMM